MTLSTLLSAAGAAVIVPHSDTLVANTISEADRAKSLSIFSVLLFAISSPFGCLGGVLFAVSDRIPFLLAAGVLLIGGGLAAFIPRLEPRAARIGPPMPMKS